MFMFLKQITSHVIGTIGCLGILFSAQISCPVMALADNVGQAGPEDFRLPVPTDEDATLTLEQLRDGVRAYFNGIWAVDVVYEQRTHSFSDNNNIVPVMKYHYAYKGEMRYTEQSRPEAEDKTKWILAYNGRLEQSYTPDRRVGSKVDRKQTYADDCAYLQALGVPLKDVDRASVGTTNFYLPYALDGAELEWKVRPKIELVDGAKCHVLESNRGECLWIDPKLGYVVRFRESRQRLAEKPLSVWPLHARYNFEGFREIGNQINLPTKTTIIKYNSIQQPENTWGSPEYYQTVENRLP